MALPPRPIAPPQALRSNPDTFSLHAELSINYQWTALPNWMEEIASFVQDQAEAAAAAAAAAGASEGFDLTGKSGFFFRVNSVETGTEFVSPAAARLGLGATETGTALLTATGPVAARTALGGTTTGVAVFTAASQAAARVALGASGVGSSVFTAAGAENAREAIFAATRPNANAGALGNFQHITATPGNPLVLPAGGSWAWFRIAWADPGGGMSSTSGGISAGGTVILNPTPGIRAGGFCWRII